MYTFVIIDLVPAMCLDALSLFLDRIQNIVVCCPGANHVLGCLDIVMIQRRSNEYGCKLVVLVPVMRMEALMSL